MIDRNRERTVNKVGNVVIDRYDLGGETGMQRILEQFYDEQIEKLDSP
ncbi:MAG: hypothetical protein PVH61_32755 [Candidatus Aminicenantes bacterium]|jgi:hypothetical protein